MRYIEFLVALGASSQLVNAVSYKLYVNSTSPYVLSVIDDNGNLMVSNTAIVAGKTNLTIAAVANNSEHTHVAFEKITDTIIRVEVNSSYPWTGATFGYENNSTMHYGVWEYPWNESIENKDINFNLQGLQGNDGVNFASARAPFWISSKGYAVYTDTKAMGAYSFSTSDLEVAFNFNSTELVYYIILPTEANNPKSLITQYATLTDTTSLFSAQSYGPMLWHNDFTDPDGFPASVANAQEFIEDVVTKLYQNKIVASAIMVDRPYGTGTEGWGNFDFDTVSFPNISQLVANVSCYGLDFQVWAANRAVPDSQLYSNASKSAWLFQSSATSSSPAVAMNLTIADAYDYLAERMEYFTKIGIKGYKIDRGDEKEMPTYEENIQTYKYHQLLYDNLGKAWGYPTATKPAGFYQFARSANDRSRKHTGIWGADPQSTADGLLASIRSGIRAGLIGFPMWGSDCGGYTRKVGKVLPTEWLWGRWMWFSAFSPVYELMLYIGSVPWYDYSDELVTVMQETAALHHQLIPYIQSYVFQSTTNGLPVIRAMFLEAPNDGSVWNSDESYFFGEEFLIAPIVKQDGSKGVYFPIGGKYLEYFNKTQVYSGGSSAKIVRDAHSIPAFVREGSIVPKGDTHQSNQRWVDSWTPYLNIEAYPSYAVPSTTFIYYNDQAHKAVNITMSATTGTTSKKICVAYGGMGYTGKLILYLAGGPQQFTLSSHGDTTCVTGASTLFD